MKKIPIQPFPLEVVCNQMLLMVRKAIEIIRQESHELIVDQKVGYDGIKEDFAPTGDKLAQAMYVQEITTHFPGFGVIAEEAELTIPCRHYECNVYFTVDPLDGTKAYIRTQSHGVGTMIALVYEGHVVAAAIGDANTGEIYYFADWHEEGGVNRERFGKVALLNPNPLPLKKQYVILRQAPREQPHIVNTMIDFPEKKVLFKNVEISGGSIGLCFARLWKGEAGAIILEPGYVTPWDETPVLGINKRLGFKHFRIDRQMNTMTEFTPQCAQKIVKHGYSELVIHAQHVEEVREWYKNYQNP